MSSPQNVPVLSFGVFPDSKVHGNNMGPTWVLLAKDGPMLVPWTLLSGLLVVSLKKLEKSGQWIGRPWGLCYFIVLCYMQHNTINSLHANFFQRKHKHVFTFYVTPPHWHAIDSWILYLYKTRTYIFYSQYHGCLCTGDARSQGINNHDIDQDKPR